ncbi:MAG TPA: TetR/AcrR family transcriptional regulator [Rudaea sp.]|jgi:AcrR family transcriptional regulator|nr:TetR/AcrR family transcriptional regulator [Rudaea sp.]
MPVAIAKPKKTVPRTNDPTHMKKRILDAAESLFQTNGYHATSMHDVMDAARVSGGALHHHFATKKDLGLAVIHDRVAVSVRETWIDPVRDSSSLATGVRNILNSIADGIDRRGSVSGCPLNNLAVELASADADFRKAVQSVFAEWQAALSERIKRTRAGTRMKANDALTAARFLIFAYSGAMNLAKTEQTGDSLRQASHTLFQWIRENDFVG